MRLHGVRAEAARFIAIRVDASDDENPETKRLTEKYKIVGLPTVIMLDGAGNEISRFNEFVPPEKFAAALKKDYSGKKVFVVGHTDSDPIAKTKGIWDDNLDLSAARARAVHKYLVDQGVPPKLLGMRAMADTDPRPNKNQSRRVEIVVSTRD